MNAHVWLAAGNVSDWIGPAIVAVFFFILPIVRAMRESRERARLAEKRARDGTPEPTARVAGEADLDAARRKWEALLRGEEVEPAAPQAPRASDTQAQSFPPAMSAPSPTSPPAAMDAPMVPESYTSLESEMSEGRQGTTFAEERLAQVEDEARERDDKQRRDDLVFAERENAEVRADVAQWISTAPPPTAVVAADLTRRRNVFGGGPGLATRAGLRRAILASEVFGRPVGLRDGSDEPGPVGLRH